MVNTLSQAALGRVLNLSTAAITGLKGQGCTSMDLPGASCSQFFKDWEQTGNTETQYPCGCPSVPSCPSQKNGTPKREHDQCAAGAARRMRFQWRWPRLAAVARCGVPSLTGPSSRLHLRVPKERENGLFHGSAKGVM